MVDGPVTTEFALKKIKEGYTVKTSNYDFDLMSSGEIYCHNKHNGYTLTEDQFLSIPDIHKTSEDDILKAQRGDHV